MSLEYSERNTVYSIVVNDEIFGFVFDVDTARRTIHKLSDGIEAVLKRQTPEKKFYQQTVSTPNKETFLTDEFINVYGQRPGTFWNGPVKKIYTLKYQLVKKITPFDEPVAKFVAFTDVDYSSSALSPSGYSQSGPEPVNIDIEVAEEENSEGGQVVPNVNDLYVENEVVNCESRTNTPQFYNIAIPESSSDESEDEDYTSSEEETSEDDTPNDYNSEEETISVSDSDQTESEDSQESESSESETSEDEEPTKGRLESEGRDPPRAPAKALFLAGAPSYAPPPVPRYANSRIPLFFPPPPRFHRYMLEDEETSSDEEE